MDTPESDVPDANPVRITVVADQLQADIVSSFLRSEGIPSIQRLVNFGIGGVMPGTAGAVTTVALGAGAALPGEVMRGAGGAREVLVRQADAERARELLAATDEIDFTPYFPDEAADQ